ncbi:MAG: GHMP kinase [Candidatus Latescibacterota bacterium]|nr:MAG: GHMP kinase [Candidatus Latescibacterota bacterium]
MIITQTPLRISLAGGGTDLEAFYRYEDGMVLNMAIDKYVYVIVKERFDDKIYINYSRKEIVDSVDQIQHELVRESMRKTGVEKGVEITTLADIPSEGSGLGSSSSITVGLLNALYMYQGEQVSPERLAREACEIEIEICGKPIGKQDQYIAAYGGVRVFTFKKDGTVDVEKINLSDDKMRKMGSNLLLFYTNRTRDSSVILRKQKAKTKQNLEILREMKALVPQAKEAVLNHNFDVLGSILRRGWELKKRLAEGISDHELDEMYDRALKAGATGGKISGAGGGGFLLLYVPRHMHDSVREAMEDMGLRELPFMLERDGSKVIFNLRRYPAK